MANKEKNFELYLNKLSQLGVDVSNISDEFKAKLMDASFVATNDYGNAYRGSLLEIVLRVLTPIAIGINKLLPVDRQVDKDKLVKVCLLHHISKAIRLIENDERWQIEKLGKLYKYDDSLPSVRTGLHSAVLAMQEFGVSFTLEEMEAMTINDRDPSDEQARFHSGVLSSIVKMANELTYVQINVEK